MKILEEGKTSACVLPALHARVFRLGKRAPAGKDTRAGMIRQHQFSKVELVSIHDAGEIQKKNMSAWTACGRRRC